MFSYNRKCLTLWLFRLLNFTTLSQILFLHGLTWHVIKDNTPVPMQILWIHKRQPIAHLDRWAMGSLLWVFWKTDCDKTLFVHCDRGAIWVQPLAVILPPASKSPNQGKLLNCSHQSTLNNYIRRQGLDKRKKSRNINGWNYCDFLFH